MVPTLPLDELERAGTDRADLRLPVFVSARQDELLADHVSRRGRQRVLEERVRLRERDDHRGRVRRGHVLDLGEHPAHIGRELWVPDPIQAEDDVIDGHDRTIVELHALPDLQRVGHAVRAYRPRLRKVRAEFRVVLAELEERLGDAVDCKPRDEVVRECRIHGSWLAFDGDRDRATDLRRSGACGRRGACGRHGGSGRNAAGRRARRRAAAGAHEQRQNDRESRELPADPALGHLIPSHSATGGRYQGRACDYSAAWGWVAYAKASNHVDPLQRTTATTAAWTPRSACRGSDPGLKQGAPDGAQR